MISIMSRSELLLTNGSFYHIYNRGINGVNLFYDERNYAFFLQKYGLYLHEVLDTYAYCLLGNHFHLLVKIKDVFPINLTGLEDLSGLKTGLHNPDRIVSKRFSDFFNCYTKSINSNRNRTGGLFETPFRRIQVDDDKYFTQLIRYIHFNPQKHGFVDNFREYQHSSYHSHLANSPTKLAREQVLEWFGNANKYKEFHSSELDETEYSKFIIEM